MNCQATKIEAVKLLEPQVFKDNRGWLTVTWSSQLMKELGIDADFIQDTHSYTALRGTIRGLHFQNGEAAQAKLVRVTRGSVLDVAVDLRKGSPSYLHWVSEELSADNKKMLYIPRGFAHGFLTLTDDVEFYYKVDNTYCPVADRSIRYDDPQISVDWGIDNPILSEKDRNAPLLFESDCSFKYPR